MQSGRELSQIVTKLQFSAQFFDPPKFFETFPNEGRIQKFENKRKVAACSIEGQRNEIRSLLRSTEEWKK